MFTCLIIIGVSVSSATSAASTSSSSFLVWWHGPVLAGGGYASEALAFITGIDVHIRSAAASMKHGNSNLVALWITPHGDGTDLKYLEGLPHALQDTIRRRMAPAHVTPRAIKQAVKQTKATHVAVVCHSEPGAWDPAAFSTSRCPPFGYLRTYAGIPFVHIGRTMFETDMLDPGHKQRLLRMDKLWVPTTWQRDVFAKHGVPTAKIDVLGEPVDEKLYQAGGGARYTRAELRQLGRRIRLDKSTARTNDDVDHGQERAVLLAVGKWESRKGFDILVRAYAAAFCAVEDDVASVDKMDRWVKAPPLLVLKLSNYHGNANAAESDLVAAVNATCAGDVWIITSHIATSDMPKLYRSATVLVQPSRGEGWGRPHSEAMACGTPVIATDWSGPTAFIDESVGFPLKNERLAPVEESDPSHHWSYKGHRWATPSQKHLTKLLRHVSSTEGQKEASVRGKAAALRMSRFSPSKLAEDIAQLLQDMHLRSAKGDDHSHEEL